VEGEIQKIIVTRPSVTAGEELGFLPGSLEGKLRPYLLPIYDSLAACGINKKALNSLIRDGTVEVAPLSFMRGRTFRNSFVIADERQNATANQMKMLLTRLGQGSRIVVIMQSDLPEGLRRSGLVDIIRRLEGRSSKHVKLVRLQKTDVVRHDAVSSILSLYEPPRRSNHQKASALTP
jgi:phosphate starvation-inducible PhoH-like protein